MRAPVAPLCHRCRRPSRAAPISDRRLRPGRTTSPVLVGAGDIAVCGAGGVDGDGQAPRWRAGHCVRRRRHRLSRRHRGAVPHLLRAGVGPPQGPHAAGAGQPRVRLAWAQRRTSRTSARTPARQGWATTCTGRARGRCSRSTATLNAVDARAQLDWLGRELDAPGASACTVAYFHHPMFSSGPHGVLPPHAGRDRVLESAVRGGRGCRHFGARTLSTSGSRRSRRMACPDAQYGIRQFIVGTGGAPLTQPVRRVANSETVLSTFGVLRLTLAPQSYRWEFLSSDGGAILDSGTGQCHGKPKS